MTGQTELFGVKPKYCIDTNVIVSFLRGTDNEFYGKDVFKAQWEYLESLIDKGLIVAPKEVESELEKWNSTIPEMKGWLKAHKRMFIDVEEDKQLESAKYIVAEYDAYGTTTNYLGDLAVMTLADALNLTVISLESEVENSGKAHPKIPNVCKEFGIAHTTFAGFLRLEKFNS